MLFVLPRDKLLEEEEEDEGGKILWENIWARSLWENGTTTLSHIYPENNIDLNFLTISSCCWT